MFTAIRRWYAKRQKRRLFLRCNSYGHEPFHMNDDLTWRCECGLTGGDWKSYSRPTPLKPSSPPGLTSP